ncbi:MAG: group II truncated hemoglobin [Rhodospirillales bacterium]|nr:group II truncated hemoglobin [Rhodospirillales bacterium]
MDAPEQIQQTPYAMIGEENLRRLVDCFYDIMDKNPDAADIRAMHKADLSPVRGALFEFLSGWLGGPALYSERTGTICLSEPHAAFEIGEAARDQWMLCMRQAMIDAELPEGVIEMIDQPLFMLADFVRNS